MDTTLPGTPLRASDTVQKPLFGCHLHGSFPLAHPVLTSSHPEEDVDIDVVVLASAHLSELDTEGLWVAFGTSKNLRYIPAHEISKSLAIQGPYCVTCLQ